METIKTKVKKFAEDHEVLINRLAIVAGAVAAFGGYLYVTDRNRVEGVRYSVSESGDRQHIMTIQKNGTIRSFSRKIEP